jgi:hypothetical protein
MIIQKSLKNDDFSLKTITLYDNIIVQYDDVIFNNDHKFINI